MSLLSKSLQDPKISLEFAHLWILQSWPRILANTRPQFWVVAQEPVNNHPTIRKLQWTRWIIELWMTSLALRFGTTMETSQSNTITHQHCPYHLIRLDRTVLDVKILRHPNIELSQVSTTLKTGPSLGGAWHGGKDKGHPAGQYLDAFGESTLRLQNCPSFLFHHPNRCTIFRPPKKKGRPLD